MPDFAPKPRITAAYFSPTGTTRRVVMAMAGHLSDLLGGAVEELDFTLPAGRVKPMSFMADNLVIFGLPVYAGRVPNVLLETLGAIIGGGARAVPVVVYGNRAYDDALRELWAILIRQNLLPVAAAAMVGEHAFSRTLAAGRPNEDDTVKLISFTQAVAEKLEQDTPFTPFPTIDVQPLAPYYQPRGAAGNPIDIRRVLPKVSSACINCGLCARICPMGSINADKVKTFTGICTKCGACVKGCPVGARYYDDPGYLYHKEDLERTFTRRAEPEFFLSC